MCYFLQCSNFCSKLMCSSGSAHKQLCVSLSELIYIVELVSYQLKFLDNWFTKKFIFTFFDQYQEV